ncbi:MAG: hypothetical protein FWC01_09235 [Treponema sp.]|nr:hypothetical protein [Treponema sp.]MCL2238123.1 hypothetical protein [Treponema sp.]
MKKAFVIIILLACFTAHTIDAQETGVPVTSSGELVLQISTLPEAKLGYTHSFTLPLFRRDNPLMENNSLKLHLTAEATPVNINAIFKTVVTPIAFIELSAGTRFGAGWSVNLFDSDIYGTGLNLPGIANTQTYSGSAFDALLWKGFLGGTFQFDLAAVVPGDWNHVVFLTYHEINFHTNSSAGHNEAWYFENDDGENMNGFNYYGNFVIGYQMPIFLSMVALLAEMDLHLYDTPGRAVWGDDLIRWHFSGILNFTITEKLGVAVITQFRTRRNFTNFDEHGNQSLHFQSRILDTQDPLRLEFYRVAAIMTYKF